MRLIILVLACVLTSLVSAGHSEPVPIYKDAAAPLGARVDDLFSRLTQDEKLTMLEGTGYATNAIPRLGVPGMEMVDAGEGVRGGAQGTQGPATLFPCGTVMAQTWDPDLLSQVGHAIGVETLNKGTGARVLLGPDVNIHRSPLGGRDAESFTEDPYLNGVLAVGYIRGLQSSGAAACVKHFACNNEEGDRDFVNVHVGERALREIYLPAFEAAVRQGGVWTVMDAYNKINGPYATANRYLNVDILKADWGFDGVVMSDWGAVHETAGVVNGGCDLEMPGKDFLTPAKLAAALQAGAITQAQIDDSVKRVLRAVIRVGLLDHPSEPDHTLVNSPDHQRLAYQTAAEGIVLLKNDRHILPLNPTRTRSIALIGTAATSIQSGAAGSPSVTPFYQVQPADAIKARLGKNATVTTVDGVVLPGGFPETIPSSALAPEGGAPGDHGLRGEYFATPDLSGDPVLTRVEPSLQAGFRGRSIDFPDSVKPRSARWTGVVTAPMTGRYMIGFPTPSACRLYLDGRLVLGRAPGGQFWRSGVPVDLTAGQQLHVRAEVLGVQAPLRAGLSWLLPERDNSGDAAMAAAKADVAVVFVTTRGTDGEGRDRPSLSLPGAQDDLVRAVAAANPNTVVVINSGSPIAVTGWLKDVRGVVDAGYPGQEAGNAIAAILFGDINPSARLTDTFGARREDYPDTGNFPGAKGEVAYDEGIYVGYRHFDKRRIAPVFPFGYGLSYTSFRYSNLKVSSADLAPGGQATMTVSVTNTGRTAGAEVVQLYVRDLSPKVDRPVRELKGFQRVALDPGQTKTATFTISARDLAYFDVVGNGWKANAGAYATEIGASSRDIRLSTTVHLTGDYLSGVR